jgi:hypothetical protein
MYKKLHSFGSENETLKVYSLCSLLIYFGQMLRGNAIFPYQGTSYEIGEHPANPRQGNSQGDSKECLFSRKICSKIFINF